MSTHSPWQRAAAAAALAFAMLALLAAGGAGADGGEAGWTWTAAIPGDERAAPTYLSGAQSEPRELVAAGDFALLAAEQDGELMIGPLVDGNARLEPLREAAADQPLLAYTAASPASGGQQVVGVVRAEVDRVDAVLADGGMRELPLNEWRGFAYTAAAAAEAATTLVASSAGSTVAVVQLPQTTTQTAAAGASAPVYGIFPITLDTEAVTLARVDARTLQPQGAGVRLAAGHGSLALSPDGNALALVASRTEQILIVDLQSLRIIRRLPLREGSWLTALAWPQPERLIAVQQRMKGPYNRNVASRTVHVLNAATGARLGIRTLTNKLSNRGAAPTPFGLVLLLGSSRADGRPMQLVLATPRAGIRTATVPVEPRNGRRPTTALAIDSSTRHAFVVVDGGLIYDIDLRTMTVERHLATAPPNSSKVVPPYARVQAEILGDDLVVAGVFSHQQHHVSGVTLIDTESWKTRLVDANANSFRVLGERLVTYEVAGVTPIRAGRLRPPIFTLDLSLYDNQARLIRRVYGSRRFQGLELTPGYGHVYYNGRSTPSQQEIPAGASSYYFGPNDQLVFGLDDGSAQGGGILSKRKPPIGPPRLIFRGSRAVGEAGERLASPPLRKTSSSNSRPQTPPALTRSGYTLSNRGKPVAPRQDRAGGSERQGLFRGQPYKLFLLGTRRASAFYRMQVTPGYACWGTGPASRIGRLGWLSCPNAIGAHPLFQQATLAIHASKGKILEYRQVAGIAADQVESVALVDRTGKTLATTQVENNLFSFPPPYPTKPWRMVALDAQQKPLVRHPEWGLKQKPPPLFDGPRATKVLPSRLEHPIQHGAGAGIGVTVGRNGVVVLDLSGIDAKTRRVLGSGISLSCFQLVRGSNIWEIRSAGGVSFDWQPKVAFRLLGIKPPLDGCQAAGSYGHRWHDGRGTHSPVEVPLTDRGQRYFELRATARDLALFVRSARTQQIRKLSGQALIAAIRREHGAAVHVLPRANATAPTETVSVWTSGTRTVFSETSSAGIRFLVEFDHGKLKRENLRGLAFVF